MRQAALPQGQQQLLQQLLESLWEAISQEGPRETGLGGPVVRSPLWQEACLEYLCGCSEAQLSGLRWRADEDRIQQVEVRQHVIQGCYWLRSMPVCRMQRRFTTCRPSVFRSVHCAAAQSPSGCHAARHGAPCLWGPGEPSCRSTNPRVISLPPRCPAAGALLHGSRAAIRKVHFDRLRAHEDAYDTEFSGGPKPQ